MLRSIGINSLGICGVGPEEEKEGTAGMVCRKGSFEVFYAIIVYDDNSCVQQTHTQTGRQTDRRTDKPRNVGKNRLHRIFAWRCDLMIPFHNET